MTRRRQGRTWFAVSGLSCLVAVGCSKGEGGRGSAASAGATASASAGAGAGAGASAGPGARASEGVGAGGTAPAAGGGRTERAEAGESAFGDVDLAPFMTARVLWGKSIGHTSVVFKLKLDGGAQAAYKPRSKRGKFRYRGEIAAYRLGRALGISNVPPALPRSFPADQLRAALGDPSSGAGKLFSEEAVANGRGEIQGAIIPWISDLHFLDLEAEPRRAEWQAWLRPASTVAADKAQLAEQISTMIVFDYLTANWDRWSGGQIGTDGTGRVVLFVDNDAAFFDPPPKGPLAHQRALVDADARFSKRFVDALRHLGPDEAKAAMGEDSPGEALLSARVLAGLEERRKAALEMVDAKISQEGEDKVLCFE